MAPFWDSLVFFRFAALALASILFAAFIWKEKLVDWLTNDKSSKHDEALFASLIALMSEQEIRDYLNQTRDILRDKPSDRSQIDRLWHTGIRTESAFLDKKIQKAFIKFLVAYNELSNFTTLYFYLDNNYYKMEPELVSRVESGQDSENDLLKFNKLMKDLRTFCNGTLAAFENFRATVKKRLRI